MIAVGIVLMAWSWSAWRAADSELLPLIAGITVVAIGGLLTFLLNALAHGAERRERLSALVRLLWLDLGDARQRLSPVMMYPVDEPVDLSLWEEVRVPLIEAGLEERIMLRLMRFYSSAARWNDELTGGGARLPQDRPVRDEWKRSLVYEADYVRHALKGLHPTKPRAHRRRTVKEPTLAQWSTITLGLNWVATPSCLRSTGRHDHYCQNAGRGGSWVPRCDRGLLSVRIRRFGPSRRAVL